MLLLCGNGIVSDDWIVDEKIPPGYARVYYITKGEIRYKDDSISKELDVGKVYIFPSLTTFRITQNPNNKLECMHLHLDLLPIAVTELIEIDLAFHPIANHIITALRLAIMEGYQKLTTQLSDAFEIYLLQESILLEPNFNIKSTLEYINSKIYEKISVSELSKHFGYNEQYFIRLFKRVMGVSPYQYILNQKLKRSLKLLNSGLTVTQVANTLGFSDIKTFSRSFKDKLGVAPTKLNRLLVNNERKTE